MKKPDMPHWVSRVLNYSAGHRYYPLVVAMVAFASTATFSFPFVIVLIPAVLLAPQRWLVLGVLTGVASGLGGGVLVEVFQFLGRELVLERYPHLVHNAHWQMATEWLHRYGLFALTVIAASPVPQTPAIFFYSLAEPSTPGVLAAVGIGKTVKYVFLAWLTARYPARFIGYRRVLED